LVEVTLAQEQSTASDVPQSLPIHFFIEIKTTQDGSATDSDLPLAAVHLASWDLLARKS
jgi:hypothetical protein